jgi:hypothetical protein
MGEQDHAFDESKRFERLLGQADNPVSGDLEYWVDISIVEGGKFRDDSFHTLFGKADYNGEFKPTGEFSMFGDAVKGAEFLSNFRLSNQTDKGFYWRMPGNGYGFLLEPALYKSSGTVRGVYSEAMVESAKRFKNTIKVDFPGEADREYYSVKSMKAPSAPSMAYLIRRDHGNKPSVFAKVMRFDSKDAPDPVASVQSVAVENTQAGIARAYLVTLSDGRSDLWILADKDTSSRVAVEGYPAVTGNGRVTVLRFDSSRNLQYINASDASQITVGGKVYSGLKNTTGKIKVIDDEKLGNIVFTVDFGNNPVPENGSGLVAVTESAGALPANWSVRNIQDGKVELNDLRFIFSTCKLIKSGNTPGKYQTSPPLAMFYNRGGMPSSAIAAGKFIRINGKYAGVIKKAEVISGNQLELTITDFQGKALNIDADTVVNICEAAPDCSITVLNNLNWSR